MTDFAVWLNSVMSGFDHTVLSFWHTAAEGYGGILTPICKFLTVSAEHGLIFYALCVILAFFRKTRKTAVCLFGAVCCGALITNIILKDYIARIRPYEAAEVFRQWWEFAGAVVEDEFSFPSGHATSVFAGMTALCVASNKRPMLLGYLYAIAVCCSRNYLMAHYPTDIIAGALIGTASAFIAYGITVLIFRFLERFRSNPVFGFMLDFSIADMGKKPGKRPDDT